MVGRRPVLANAYFTVFFEHPSTRAIALIGILSALRSRRISAQSSTFSTHFLLTSTQGQDHGRGSVFTCR